MYPSIGSISLLGVGIIISIIIFSYSFYRFCRNYSISSSYALKNMGYFIIFSYIFSSYSYYFIEEFTVFPLHRKQILLYLSPYDFTIHIIGLITSIIIIFFMIQKTYLFSSERKLFRSAFFDSFMLSTIVFGFFLILDDSFFGFANIFIKIQPLTVNSDWAAFDYVFPLGFLVSLTGLGLYGLITILRHKGYKSYEYLGRGLWFFLMCCITLIQHYPRHLVYETLGIQFDIKQYFFLILTIISFYKFFRE